MTSTPKPHGQRPDHNRDAGKRLPGIDDRIEAMIWVMYVPDEEKDKVEQTSRELNMSEADVRRMLVQRFFDGEAE